MYLSSYSTYPYCEPDSELDRSSTSNDAIPLHARPRPNAVVTETVILLYENVVEGKLEN